MVLLVALMGNSLYAQKDLDKLMQQRGEYYFSLNVQDLNEVQAINEICSVDKINGNNIICYANNNQYELLLKQGYKPSLLTPPSMENEAKMWDQRGTYEWDSYLTYTQYVSMMEGFPTSTVSGRTCTLVDLGTLSTSNHRRILGVRVNNGNPNGKPRFLYTSTMHGDEVTGMILMLRLINELCTSTDSRIVDLVNNLDIFIFPCTNPDGTYYGGNNSVNGARRYNGNGIDLNRHFPDFDDGNHPDGQSYYQDEAQWMMDLAQQYLFTMAANYHGGAEVMNYPWDTYQPVHPDDAWWRYVCLEYANLAKAVNSSYMTDTESNGITNGYAWYTISGSRQDYMNYYAQCREVTIECSSSKTPSASQLPNFWNYNHNSMLTYMEEALYGIHGVVTDANTGETLTGVNVTIENHDHHGSSVTTHEVGDYHRPIKAGTYSVTYSLSGYQSQTISVTVADGQTTIQNVQLVPLEGLVPDFTASSTTIAPGNSINFTDATWGNHLTSWQWQFEGATPATSNVQNPTGITYNGTGTFDVTLTVTNSDGDTETVTKNDYITVADSYNMQNGSITTCSALFYDAQGPNSNYGNNQTYTMTFNPGSEDAKISVNFSEFNTESGYDYLYIYDGTSTSATQIGRYSGTTSPGTVTATNTAGALTFKFTSDGSVNASGWVATVHCIYSEEPLAVTASASTAVIRAGQSTELTANATGGSGTYTYSWSPTTGLNNANIQSPTATPASTTTYTCTVNDGSNSANATVTITVVKAPTSLTATVSESDVTLNWAAANPATSYKVYRNNTMIAQNVTATTYTDSGLENGTYSYTVTAIYQNVESPHSATATATVQTTPSGLLGDADVNGQVNINDVLAIMRHALQITFLSDEGLLLADVNGSGSVDINDAVTLLRQVLGIR